MTEKITVYQVDHALCIGCHRCFKVCTYQAVSGNPKEKHTIDPARCMACGACFDCPKKAISKVEVEASVRTVEIARVRCECCGALTITTAQADWGSRRKGVNAEAFKLCDECKRRRMVGQARQLMGC
ncbi:MAG TPA: 4Fe-4S dicluster domain-containing protein [Myxococcota bacterium]|nr:4Fe-4S dicluster domain-containing protein [Myxococcota bacterium]HOA13608.1 4Fe-4S dicluster domain-containing protein [Myxococcota bacterium]HOC99244.1 4Fe-4S dicluster domain-containing protein [Myxococcota bacterium]HOH76956.1 4Fe-4S dicluster domain-containing protein [Myxococcota bacterium]HPV04760.1 4Fe-4S dicluster domain-containing protein [Myxococcota bacterium]